MRLLLALAVLAGFAVPLYSDSPASSSDRTVMTVASRNANLERLTGKTRDQVINAIGRPILVWHNIIEYWDYRTHAGILAVCFEKGVVTEISWDGRGGRIGLGRFVLVPDQPSGSGSD